MTSSAEREALVKISHDLQAVLGILRTIRVTLDLTGDTLIELNGWLSERMRQNITPEQAPLVAQVINALNLSYLVEGKLDAIEANMRDLSESVIPRITSRDQRDHIEGNAHYQRSILARRRQDRNEERSARLRAMESDRHFATLYYRMAQILHDQGDGRAETFYEMAVLLSPVDLPTANDYGCWLLDAGQEVKFESWSVFCQRFFPEQFENTAAGAAS